MTVSCRLSMDLHKMYETTRDNLTAIKSALPSNVPGRKIGKAIDAFEQMIAKTEEMLSLFDGEDEEATLSPAEWASAKAKFAQIKQAEVLALEQLAQLRDDPDCCRTMKKFKVLLQEIGI